jgi:hypothetical protein
VQALNSNFGSGTQLNSTIAWDFGDPGSNYNDMVGFNAAHAYANAGNYTITLTITTPDGHVGVTTQNITIGQDNRNTIYVSANGDDSNNGSSPNSAIQSIDRLDQLIGSNTRVLFQDGGTYNVNNNAINLYGLQHVYVGSYGSGAQPIIMDNGYVVSSIIGLSATSQGIVIQGLTFDSIDTSNDGGAPDAVDVVGNDISVLDSTFYNFDDDFNLNQEPTNVLVQDNSSPSQSALDGYFAWIQGNEIVMLGNNVANSLDQADLRVDGSNDVELAFNNFGKVTPAGQSYKNCFTIQQGSNIYLYDNQAANGPILVGPLATDGAPTNASVQDCVIDSNSLTGDVIIIDPGSINTMVKNNILNPSESYAIYVNSIIDDGGYNWQVQNLWIDNNTVDTTSPVSGLIFLSGGESQNITVDNNLFVDPDLIIGDDQAAFIWDANNDLNSFNEIKNNVWSTPATISWWMNGGTFDVGDGQTDEAAWLTPSEWDSQSLAGGGSPSGDIVTSISLGSTYSFSVDGITAGSPVPTP